MAFFQEEINTCQLYSLKDQEYLCTYERMWAACTSVVDAKYTSPFTEEMKEKLREMLSYDDALLQLSDSAEFARYFEVWHKDNVVEKASINTAFPWTYTKKKNSMPAKLAYGITRQMLETCEDMFVWWSPTDVWFDKIYIDANLNSIGLSVSPTDLDPTYLPDSDYARINTALRKKPHIKLDYDIYTDREEIVLTSRVDYHNFSFQVRRNNAVDAITDIGAWKYVGVETNTPRDRSMQMGMLRELDVITDDEVTWILSICDHEEQEVDLDYVFNKDGSLKDIIVLKRDARDFQIWRSEPS